MAARWKACGRGCEPACVRWPLRLLVLRVSTSSCGRNLPGNSERDRGSVPQVAVRWLLCSSPCECGFKGAFLRSPLSRRSRTRHRLGVRIEESWPLLMAVLMVGGERSTEGDSRRFRSSLVSKPWLRALLQATNRTCLFLDNAFALIDECICADLNAIFILFFATRRRTIHSGLPVKRPESKIRVGHSALWVGRKSG
jgi:hypothetical protein